MFSLSMITTAQVIKDLASMKAFSGEESVIALVALAKEGRQPCEIAAAALRKSSITDAYLEKGAELRIKPGFERFVLKKLDCDALGNVSVPPTDPIRWGEDFRPLRLLAR